MPSIRPWNTTGCGSIRADRTYVVRTDDCVLLHYCVSEQQYLLENLCKSLDGVSTVDHDVDNEDWQLGCQKSGARCKANAGVHAVEGEGEREGHTSGPMGFQYCMTLLRLLDVLRVGSAKLLLADVPCSLSSRTKSGSSSLQHTIALLTLADNTMPRLRSQPSYRLRLGVLLHVESNQAVGCNGMHVPDQPCIFGARCIMSRQHYGSHQCMGSTHGRHHSTKRSETSAAEIGKTKDDVLLLCYAGLLKR